jgi:four helix bundle protein
MARDHRKLRVFHESHRLTVCIYKETKNFPRDEWFGLRAQMRRCSVSIPSNIVEGSARRTTREYLNFCNIARGSGSELGYLVELAFELGLIASEQHRRLQNHCDRLIPQLESLVQQVEILVEQEKALRKKRKAQSLRPKAQSLSVKPRA